MPMTASGWMTGTISERSSAVRQTADIEQALVIGAQAARGVTVVLVDE